MRRNKTVLVSGAGIAGPTLAYWLLRAGMEPIIVEASPELRTGGYMIDFWGLGFAVAEAMGLGPRLREIGYAMRELTLVDEAGRITARLMTDAMRNAIGERYVSLLRGDLARELDRSIHGQVEVIFGNEITFLAQDADGVQVGFAHGAPRRFDLVIGADGVHSNVRRMIFGREDSFEIGLGYSFAAFSARNYPHRDELTYVSRTIPGRQVVRCTLRDGSTVFFMVLASELTANYPVSTTSAQKRCLIDAFRDIGWEGREIVEAVNDATDLYFDSVSQVHMPAWSRGRVALVGDAAYCPSLLAGEGSSFAMAGAFQLAGELLAAGGDHMRAFLAYEWRFKPFLDRKQRSARRLGAWFAPRTHLGLFVRNQITRLATVPGFSNLIVEPIVANELRLPQYTWDGKPVRASA
jgi:2-polyprenyl-6-methoxyphenol hydroxylase-like FAD-dependent oxidoreductase